MTTRANNARPPFGTVALSWLPALLGMAVLFYSSSLPGDEINLPPFDYSDKAVHFAAYGVLGVLIAWRKGLRRAPKDDGQDLFGIIAGMLYGVGDEIHQIFVPLRMFAFSDMAADFLGVAVGVWAYRKFTGRASAPN